MLFLLGIAATAFRKAAVLAASDGWMTALDALGIYRSVAIAAVLWALLLIPAAILSEESTSYRTLQPPGRVEWLSRIISDIHAVVITAGMYVAIFQEPPDGLYSGGPFLHRTLFRTLLTLGLGYFLYDSLLVLIMHATISSPFESIAHHMVSMLCTLYVLTVDKPIAYVWCGGIFLTEASTPFVNQRWFMAIRHRHEKKYFATGLSMTIAFILVRPIGIPVFLHWMWNRRQALLHALNTTTKTQIAVIGTIACTALYALNLYWTALIIKGFLRALCSANHAPHTKAIMQNRVDRELLQADKHD